MQTLEQFETRELQSWKASIEKLISNPRLLEDEAMVKFIAYDKDRNGYLDFNEIKACLNDLCAAHEISRLPEAEVRSGFDEIDTNKDGKITLEEFVPFVREMLQITLQYISSLLLQRL